MVKWAFGKRQAGGLASDVESVSVGDVLARLLNGVLSEGDIDVPIFTVGGAERTQHGVIDGQVPRGTC